MKFCLYDNTLPFLIWLPWITAVKWVHGIEICDMPGDKGGIIRCF
jgi:hypothetical protein